MRRGVGAMLAVVVLAASACSSSHVSASSPADGYRVVYRVEDRSSPKSRIVSDVVEVDRPFSGRVESRVGGKTTTGQVTNREFFWQLGKDAVVEFGLRRAPAGAARDVSYGALTDAAQHGISETVGSGRYLGRRCTWFAYGEPSPAALVPPTRMSRVESCVDPSGVLLAEVWSLDGRAVRIMQAASVRPGPPTGRRFFSGRDPASVRVRNPGALRLLLSQFAVDDDARVDPPTALRAPSGWKRDRRAVVSAAAAGGRATQFVVEAFVRGNELVVVERAASSGLQPPWPPDEGVRIDLGALGSGRVVHYVDRVEIRLIGNVGFVRVAAPTRRIALTFVRGLRDSR